MTPTTKTASIFKTSDKSAAIYGFEGRAGHEYFCAAIKPAIKGCVYQPNLWQGYYRIKVERIPDAIAALEANGITVKTFTDKNYIPL